MTSRISDITYLIFTVWPHCHKLASTHVFSLSTISVSVWNFIIETSNVSVVCLHCHCFTMQCMWYVCDTFLLLPLECPAYLLVVISQISCFHCMRQQRSGSTLHRAQSAQITPVISQEWKGLKHAIVHSFHHFPRVYLSYDACHAV